MHRFRKTIVLLLPLLVLLNIGIAHAAEVKYAEFSSSLSSNPITLSDVSIGTVSQQFVPFDDYISGVDLWIDNTSPQGSMTVKFYKESTNQLLSSKTITVPNISETWAGQQYHIQFNSPVNIVSGDTYRIDITSSIQNLRLYKTDLVIIQQHNSNYSIGNTVLPAYLGGIAQDFAFQYALYEDGDISPPVITNVVSSVLSDSLANITFDSNEPIDARVLFAPVGQTPTTGTVFTGNYTECPPGISTCQISLNTEAGTTYDFELIAKDSWSNETSKTGSFTSGQVPPEEEGGNEQIVLDITNTQALSLNHNSATISWITNVAANSSIVVTVSGGTTIAEVNDSAYELFHLISTGALLSPETQYFVEITSVDAGGNEDKHNLIFTTLGATTSEAIQEDETTTSTTTEGTSTVGTGEMTAPSSEPTASVTPNNNGGYTVTIGWSVPEGNEPTDGYRIDIFDSDNNLRLSLLSDTNSIDVGDLEAGEYNAVIYSNNDGIFERINQIPFTIPGLTKTVSTSFRLYTVFGSATILVILWFVLAKIRKIRFAKEPKKTKKSAGFSLVEIIVSVGIMVVIVISIGVFIRDVASLDSDLATKLAAQQEIELTIRSMISEIRSAEASNEGSYPIAVASSSTLTFYTDIGGDGIVEKVRYFINGNKLQKGIIVPNGAPLGYDPLNEVVSDMVNNFITTTSSLFTYYDENFTGTEDPLTIPLTISEIRIVETNIAAKEQSQKTPIEFGARVTLRNLRTNVSSSGGGGGGTEADSLTIDTSSANIGGGGNKELRGVTIENTGTSNITIDTITLTWTNGQLIEEVKIGGTQIWKYNGVGSPDGRQPAGTEIDTQDYVISNGATDTIDKFKFDDSLLGDTFTITFKMSDGSTKSTSSFSP